MKQLAVLIVTSLAVLRIEAKLGPYYAHTCSGTQTKIQCPGDFQIAFNGMIYSQYQTNYSTCGSVTADDLTLLSLCSSLISSSADSGPLAFNFQSQCVGKSECSFSLNFQHATSATCNLTSVENVVRVMFSCILQKTTGQDEVVVCSDPKTGKAATQFLACPSSTVISIDKILAQSAGRGSVCNSYLESNFEAACSYALSPSHDFYRLVVDTCSGWTACAVKGTLIENANSNTGCAATAERNFQRIYYSCVPEKNTKVTLCSNSVNNPTPVRINCDGSYIKITNVVADRIYNVNPSACPVDDSARNVEVFGCAVQVQDVQFLDGIASNCNGKATCDVSVSTYVAAPCGADNARTRNWFAISYQCTKTPETDGYRTARACSGSQLTLQCPTGALLSFGSIYATVLFATGDNATRGDYSCNTSLSLGNSELTSCTLRLSSSGSGSLMYNAVTACKDKNVCILKFNDTIDSSSCTDYSKSLPSPRTYVRRDLYDVQYMCATPAASDTSSSDSSTPVNSIGLGLGLTALFLVLIGAIVGVVIYRRRNRDGMTTKMSAPSAGNNYSNF